MNAVHAAELDSFGLPETAWLISTATEWKDFRHNPNHVSAMTVAKSESRGNAELPRQAPTCRLTKPTTAASHEASSISWHKSATA